MLVEGKDHVKSLCPL